MSVAPMPEVEVFETEAFTVANGMNPKSKAVPFRLTVPLDDLTPEHYVCQVTVLDPSSQRLSLIHI